ncbi:Cell number regulator 1, partial [Capsicum chinense]
QPHQEYTQVESFNHHQAHETTDEIHPQSIEPFHEDLYPEESQDEPSQELTLQSESQENQDSVQQQQYVQVASRPVTTQFSQQNGNTQGPRKQPKPQSGAPRSPLQPSQHNSFPVHDPQPQAEAFPPPQSQPLPHPFPPAQDYYEPHTFPPTQEEQEEAHAFPPTVPQAFPPSQDYYEPHGFPPTLEKADFPPTPNKAHAFPPPHVDPQLYPSQAKPQAFVPQNHNVPAFASSQTQAGTNFPQHGLAQGSQIGMGMGQYPQGTPSASPMSQTPMIGIPSKPLIPTESWKTGLFGCMENPTNALITAFFPCLTFGQIAEIGDSGHTNK